MKTAAAYLRLSYKQVNGKMVEEDRDGISRQRADIKSLAASNGAVLPDEAIFYEDDTSGSKKRNVKSEWEKLKKFVADHKPDFLFGTAADRLGRRLADIEDLDDLTRETGTKVLTLKEGDLFSSPAWPFIAAQAKAEAMNTAIRVQRSQEARRQKGRDSGGGHRPYGYKSDRMTVIEKEAEVIRDVVRRVSKGETINSIAMDLNRRKVATVTKGKEWSTLMVRRMAQNPRYAGLNVHKEKVVGTAAWPAIITLPEHEAVKRALSTVSKPKAGRPTSSLLGGIVRCGNCGMPMNSTRSGKRYYIYRCSGNSGGRAGCGRLSRGRDLVDAWVTERIMTQLDESVIEHERRAAHVPM
jgi:DNA invertase Pin-like site-specific DNA recombinase